MKKGETVGISVINNEIAAAILHRRGLGRLTIVSPEAEQQVHYFAELAVSADQEAKVRKELAKLVKKDPDELARINDRLKRKEQKAKAVHH